MDGLQPLLHPPFAGPDAVGQWQRLMAELKPMSSALYNSPPFGALRDDSFVPITMGRYARRKKDLQIQKVFVDCNSLSEAASPVVQHPWRPMPTSYSNRLL